MMDSLGTLYWILFSKYFNAEIYTNFLDFLFFSKTNLLKLNDTCWDGEVRNCPILVTDNQPTKNDRALSKTVRFLQSTLFQDDYRSRSLF